MQPTVYIFKPIVCDILNGRLILEIAIRLNLGRRRSRTDVYMARRLAWKVCIN